MGHLAESLELAHGAGELVGASPELIEQPCVLDRDHRLAGKVFHKLDLLVRKRSDLLTVDAEGSNELAVLEHGNRYERPSAAEISRGAPLRIAFDIGSLGPHIRNVDRLLRVNNSFQRRSGERQPRAGKQIFGKSRWHTEMG